MKIKNVKDMDYYELLNIKRTASVQEIERAYHLCKVTYQEDSIAHYSLVSREERKVILDRIEKAYQILSDSNQRKLYDLKMFESKDTYKEKAFFRRSTEKLVIEDTEEKISFWRKLKYKLISTKKK
jgi:DnaJ-class molecular chaperone